MNTFHPLRRDEGIRIEEFQGEVLVYDLDAHTAHCLNGIAVSVWQYADGTRSVLEIAERIAADQGTEADEELVLRALDELDRASLLATPLASAPVELTRRHLVTKLGWAAAIPLVLSVTVPTPAYAQTGVTTS